MREENNELHKENLTLKDRVSDLNIQIAQQDNRNFPLTQSTKLNTAAAEKQVPLTSMASEGMRSRRWEAKFDGTRSYSDNAGGPLSNISAGNRSFDMDLD